MASFFLFAIYLNFTEGALVLQHISKVNRFWRVQSYKYKYKYIYIYIYMYITIIVRGRAGRWI